MNLKCATLTRLLNPCFATLHSLCHDTEDATRYAADGDANVEAGAGASKQQEGDKLQALESEVLEYPG